MGQEGAIKDLGPCVAIFNGVQAGATFGDVTLTGATETQPILEDENGTTPVDEVGMGKPGSQVIVPFTRTTLAQLAELIPNSVLDGTEKRLTIKNPVGCKLSDKAAELVLKPVVCGAVSTDPEEWLTVFSAAPKDDIEITFNTSGQRVYSIIFVMLPATVSGVTGCMYKIGNVVV